MKHILVPALAWLLFACSEPKEQPAEPHTHGPHDGMTTSFTDGTTTGHLELKLHDDKGDLELWIGEDDKLTRPFDLPVRATVEVEFLSPQKTTVTLRTRDKDNNPDEDGRPNVRNGKTNYFIFPSQTGEDASWLQGKEFRGRVVVRFARAGKEFASKPFELMPHSH